MFRALASRLPRRTVFGLLALALVASAIVGGFAGQADAAPSELRIWTYYSDATMTVPVGGKAISCSGSTSKWGRTSLYVELDTEPCF